MGGIAGGMFIAQSVAPLIGGAFTDYLSWRWCFWINLPIGGVTFAGIFFFAKLSQQSPEQKASTWRDQLAAFLQKADLLNTLIILPCIICLLLALQWGGLTYAWSDWRIILLFCVFGVLSICWVVRESKIGDRATVPGRIIKQRSIAAAAWMIFCLPAAMFIMVYFVPEWFQVVKGVTATQSGVDYLAVTIPQSVATVLSGVLVSLPEIAELTGSYSQIGRIARSDTACPSNMLAQ
jgi:predicted MFS family arabinose efflux permease